MPVQRAYGVSVLGALQGGRLPGSWFPPTLYTQGGTKTDMALVSCTAQCPRTAEQTAPVTKGPFVCIQPLTRLLPAIPGFPWSLFTSFSLGLDHFPRSYSQTPKQHLRDKPDHSTCHPHYLLIMFPIKMPAGPKAKVSQGFTQIIPK